MSRRVAIISDFDGTIAERDIGHHFFGNFVPDRAAWEELLEKWKLGLISSRECLQKEIEWVQADQADLDGFVEGEKFDQYFKDFVDFCNREKLEFQILSDGLDYYIESLLNRYALSYLDYRANHLVLVGGGIAGIEFPYYNLLDCRMCGNCKRFHVEKLGMRGFFTVYIGNGYSDRCPSEHADMVFAKGDLLDHCRQKRIGHIEFSNFRDVERELTRKFYLGEKE